MKKSWLLFFFPGDERRSEADREGEARRDHQHETRLRGHELLRWTWWVDVVQPFTLKLFSSSLYLLLSSYYFKPSCPHRLSLCAKGRGRRVVFSASRTLFSSHWPLERHRGAISSFYSPLSRHLMRPQCVYIHQSNRPSAWLTCSCNWAQLCYIKTTAREAVAWWKEPLLS